MSTPSANDSILLIEFDLSPAITRKDSSGIFNENMLSGTAGAHYTLALSDPYVIIALQYLILFFIGNNKNLFDFPGICCCANSVPT